MEIGASQMLRFSSCDIANRVRKVNRSNQLLLAIGTQGQGWRIEHESHIVTME